MKKTQKGSSTDPNSRKEAILAIVTVIMVFLASGLFFSAVKGIAEGTLQLDKNRSELCDSIFNIFAYITSGIIICILVNKQTEKKISSSLSIRGIDITFIILMVLSIRALQDIVMQIITLILSDHITLSSESGHSLSVIFVIEAVIAAPIIEEIVFRYACIELLDNKFRSWIIIFAVSIVFALMHTYNIQGFFSIFILSAAVSVLYYRTRNMIYPISIHILYNASCLIDRTQFKLFNTPIVTMKNGFYNFTLSWIVLQFIVIIVMCIYVKFLSSFNKNLRTKDRLRP